MQLHQTLLIINGVANIDLQASFTVRGVLGKIGVKFMSGILQGYNDLTIFVNKRIEQFV